MKRAKVRMFLLKFFKYVINNLISFDQTINTLAGGDPDETISSRLGRNYPHSVLARIVDVMFFWQSYNKVIKSHVINAIEAGEGGDAVLK
jgi:hypothetical protein